MWSSSTPDVSLPQSPRPSDLGFFFGYALSFRALIFNSILQARLPRMLYVSNDSSETLIHEVKALVGESEGRLSDPFSVDPDASSQGVAWRTILRLQPDGLLKDGKLNESLLLCLKVGTLIFSTNAAYRKLIAEFESLIDDGFLDGADTTAVELLVKQMTPEQAVWEHAYFRRFGRSFTGAERSAVSPTGLLYLVDDKHGSIEVTTPEAWVQRQIAAIARGMSASMKHDSAAAATAPVCLVGLGGVLQAA